MYCRNCGKELPENVKFCRYCGQAVPAAKSAGIEVQEKKERKRRRGLKASMIGMLLVLCVVLAGTAFIWLRKADAQEIVFSALDVIYDRTSGEDVPESDAPDDMESSGDIDPENEGKASEMQRTDDTEESLSASSEEAENQSSLDTFPEKVEQEAGAEEKDETEIHRYELVLEDVTWQQAFEKCIDRGGYLLHINSMEEYDYIVNYVLNNVDKNSLHVYLGGRRDWDGTEYRWVNQDNQLYGDRLEASNSWCRELWYKDEPSYSDETTQINGENVPEAYMNLFKVSGVWYMNDASDDLVGVYPNYLKGNVGYIIEFDE